jgi:hypothetical protein
LIVVAGIVVAGIVAAGIVVAGMCVAGSRVGGIFTAGQQSRFAWEIDPALVVATCGAAGGGFGFGVGGCGGGGVGAVGAGLATTIVVVTSRGADPLFEDPHAEAVAATRTPMEMARTALNTGLK